MDNQVEQPRIPPIQDDDNIREEFQCCICLDLLYKPVVVACGHLACFWCIFHAMNNDLRESYCPVCRHAYNHFPRTCKLLHFLLQKLYPTAYARREKQISEVEEKSGVMSQQFDNLKSETSASAGVLDSNCIPEEIKATVMTASSSEANTDVGQQNGWTEIELPDGSNKKLVISDLTCGVCKQMLYRPVVLNCGDVYCEFCISKSSDTICKCPVCQSMHPRGFPKMCLVLEHFLEEEFPEEYRARKEWYLKEKSDQLRSSAGEVSSLGSDGTPADVVPPLTIQGSKLHFYVGCDYCGMYPIVGERYRCKDCKESTGFDLCQGCYVSSCKLPGRFNQQHTEDHQFEKVDTTFHQILARIGAVSNSAVILDYRRALLRARSVHHDEIGSNDVEEHEDGSLITEDVGIVHRPPSDDYHDDGGDDGTLEGEEEGVDP
ncbi:hypothetical protein LIER_21696 [Lithospermum erythrorhizon]|uniref:E3 ubiquitin-protein ligase PRT1 n=1 Tax=Lithospermum erythrorhizon TaxID=34254 RepID=A0AAV3QRA2_LITER